MTIARPDVPCARVALASALAITSIHMEASAGDAETLFVEGKRLMAQGRTKEACDMLERSEQAEHGLGTRFHLGLCRERIGLIASAYTDFLAVAEEAHARGQRAREAVARDYAARLEDRLVRLRVDVDPRDEDANVSVNGRPLDRSQWMHGVPIDPGYVTVEASAPRKRAWSRELHVSTARRTWTVAVPPLAKAESPAPPPPPPASETNASPDGQNGPHDDNVWLRTAAFAAAASAVGAFGVGAYLGVDAIRTNRASSPHCRGNDCDAEGVSLRADAVAQGDRSTAAFIVGGALLAGAGIMWALAPAAPSRGKLEVVTGPGRIALRGAW